MTVATAEKLLVFVQLTLAASIISVGCQTSYMKPSSGNHIEYLDDKIEFTLQHEVAADIQEWPHSDELEKTPNLESLTAETFDEPLVLVGTIGSSSLRIDEVTALLLKNGILCDVSGSKQHAICVQKSRENDARVLLQQLRHDSGLSLTIQE